MSILDSVFASVTGNNSLDLNESEIVATAEEAAEAVVDAAISDSEADIAEHEKDIQSHEVAIESLEDKVEELEEIIDGQESMMSGATPFNAGLFHDRMVRGAKIVARMGAPIEVGGVESYADASTANLQAYSGIESMKETATKAIAAAKKFFIDLYNSFISLFTGLFNKLKAQGDKAQVMKSALLKGGEVKSDVTPPKSASLLETNGKSKAVDVLVRATGTIYSEMNKLGSGAVDSGAAAVSAIAEEIAKVGSKSVEGKTDSTETLDVKVGQSGKLKIVSPLKDGGIGSTKLTFTLGEAPAKSSASKSDLVSVLTEVIDGSRKLQNAKLDKTALAQQRDKAIGVMSKLAAMEPDAGKDEKKQGAGAIKAAHAAALKLGTGALRLGGEIMSAQIDFVKAHVGGSAKKDDAGKKEDDKKDEDKK